MLSGFRYIKFIFALIAGIALTWPTLAMANSAPALKPVLKQYVLEGQMLSLNIVASDTDSDPVELATTLRPDGSSFTDNGDGTGLFQWMPDFAGPNSADGSPFEVTFLASDGQTYSLIQTEIVVINNNRKPVITAPDTVTAASGDLINFQLSGFDADLDPVTWYPVSMPSNMEFQDGATASFNWQTTYADSGIYTMQARLVDSYGAADTGTVVLKVLQTEVYQLSIDTLSAFPGERASVNINLNNLEEVSGFSLVINYDASALTFSSVLNSGTRTESFEYFNYQFKYRNIPGDLLISGVSDIANEISNPDLPVGDGPIAVMEFYITYDISFAGFSIPIKFVFRDPFEQNDNTMTDPAGERIEQNQISYYDGYVAIKSTTQNRLGDINLNGLTYEIGDIIYFTNYFTNPAMYPLSPIQILNSDVNKDGYAPTVADLVFMVNRLVNIAAETEKISPSEAFVDIYLSEKEGSYEISYNSGNELGALALVIDSDAGDDLIQNLEANIAAMGMTVKSSVDGNLVRMLVYSEDGIRMPSGRHTLIEIDNNSNIDINEIQLSSADGYVLNPVMKGDSGDILPEGFRLYQNRPNPFNPVTEISFSIPGSSPVRLSVFNILGQEIRTLVDKVLPAGNHTVFWDGKDSNGHPVSSGIYFYRLGAESFSARKKMILLK